MEIREAKETDIPEIVEVLKASLGEAEIQLSEDVWSYKHLINPFGKSLVLIAHEEGGIIGVRAFMRWQWRSKEKIFNAFRAVDTATHPNHQGKGVFKKLTLAAVELAKKNGDHFVFNTPNDQSRPGYLKMGWEAVDNVVVSLQPAYKSFWKIKPKKIAYEVHLDGTPKDLERLCEIWNTNLMESKKLFTSKTPHYLKWRYQNNPLQEYEVLFKKHFYLAGYIKNRGKIRELRISECIYNGDKGTASLIQKTVSSWASKFSVQLISFSPKVAGLKYPAKKGNYGPVLTLKDLNLQLSELNVYKNIENWNYSLGDLELF
ncbi:GNAT family N-acetyltransferase [Salinimicrobium sp. TIG7-5_MAKvit]|uniref:GNAT family N-acetyltransferase n=1 Tax=Salinimicrobium sp. TIG7-5_MAKvit TaxID=3121289 RepID=UPI003C6E98DA